MVFPGRTPPALPCAGHELPFDVGVEVIALRAPTAGGTEAFEEGGTVPAQHAAAGAVPELSRISRGGGDAPGRELKGYGALDR